VCDWTNIEFVGVKGESLCTGGTHPLAATKFSAKNSCANKKVFLRVAGTGIQTCMNPTGERPFVEFNEIFVGAEGSRC
jgi:hypothetical protein